MNISIFRIMSYESILQKLPSAELYSHLSSYKEIHPSLNNYHLTRADAGFSRCEGESCNRSVRAKGGL